MVTANRSSVLFPAVTFACVWFASLRTCCAEFNIDWTTVGDAQNAADSTGVGAVDYDYRIGTYEVTNQQYSEFLNAVAAEDPNGLYNEKMDVRTSTLGGIVRRGESGSYTYETQAGRAEKPVIWVSFWDSIRFSNWLHNGQPTGAQDANTTEDGAYSITPDAIAANSVTRNEGAVVYIPSADEWYKAAYYKGGGSESGYWQYPFETDDPTRAAHPPGIANDANIESEVGDVTDIGAYSFSRSPYGVFDLGGNVWEWNESIVQDVELDSFRGVRGGSWNDNFRHVQASVGFFQNPNFENLNLGFRVASVPEPNSIGLVGIAIVGLVFHRGRRTRTIGNASRENSTLLMS